MTKTIGMIGIGLMGHGIASNIVKKGWPLQFLDHVGNQPAQDLIDNGAIALTDQAELARTSNIIILCVTGTPQIEAILLGDDNGVLAAIRPGTIIIDCSTAIPSSTEAIAKQVETAGGKFIDAAMTRTPFEAAQGRLNLLIGGEQSVFEEVKPLLETFAENLFYAGKSGSGHKLKLIHNFVSLGFATLLSEAAACADKGGIPAEVLVDALYKGGGYGAALDRIAPFLLEGDESRMQFTLNNTYKDLSYYNTMAQEQNSSHAIAAAIKNTIETIIDTGVGDTYLASVAQQFGKLKT